MKQNLPPGWDEERIREVIAYYDNQTEEEAIAEAEEAEHLDGYSWVQVPTELMPEIHRLLSAHEARQEADSARKKPSKRKAKPS